MNDKFTVYFASACGLAWFILGLLGYDAAAWACAAVGAARLFSSLWRHVS